MPIYEYECTKCGHLEEVWQTFSDPPVTKCELCRGKMKKLISQSTFHLKGTGWYVTDYGSHSHGNEKKREKSEKDTTTKEGKDTTDGSKKGTGSSSARKATD